MGTSTGQQADPLVEVNHLPVAALGILTICVYGSWYYSFGVLLDPIRLDTGWSESALAGSYSWGLFVIGLGSVFGGRFLDHFGSRAVFLLAAGLGAISFGIASSTESALIFGLAASIGMGVFGALGFYHVSMTLAVRLNPESPGRAIAVLTLWGAVASAIYLPLAAWLVERLDWRDAMRILTGSAVVAFLLAAVVIGVGPASAADPESASPAKQNLAQTIRVMLSNPQARLFTLVLAVGGTCWTSLLVYQVPVMTAVGLPLATASAVAGFRGFCQILGRLPIGWIVDRVGADAAMMLAFATMTIGAILLSFANTIWVAAAFAVIAGFGIGAFSPLQGIRSEQLYDRDMLGAAMGFHSTVVMLSGAAAPFVIGVVAERTGERRWASVFIAIAGVGAIALIEQLRRRSGEAPIVS